MKLWGGLQPPQNRARYAHALVGVIERFGVFQKNLCGRRSFSTHPQSPVPPQPFEFSSVCSPLSLSLVWASVIHLKGVRTCLCVCVGVCVCVCVGGGGGGRGGGGGGGG